MPKQKKPKISSVVHELRQPPQDIEKVDIRNMLEYQQIVELIDLYSYNKENCKSVLEDIINVANKKIYFLTE